jgi:hypothetical protein
MTTRPDDGLLYGCKAIAAHLKLTPRQAAHLIDKGFLPTFRLGTIICSTKSALAEHFSEQIRATKGDDQCKA